MGIADRARDALRPTNRIEAVFEPGQSQAKGLHGANLAVPATSPAPTSQGSGAPDRTGQTGKRPAYASEPQAVSKSYYVEEKNGERRYFDDYQRTALAMRATETAVISKRQDLNTIRAMLEIAQSRGWKTVEIRGTTEFRREAWIEATARGLEGRGFTATDVDHQEAERRRAERGPANEVRAQAAPAQAPKPQGPQAPAPASLDLEAGKSEPGNPTLADHRKVVREAQKALSPDGRLMLAALSEKIDRQMSRHNTETKAELKAFVASELLHKEWGQGPIVLSADQKRTASTPEWVSSRPTPEPTPAVASRREPQAPRRTLSR